MHLETILLTTNQVYDRKSLCTNWSHCIGCDLCQ
jgi:hypothetical protein